MLSQAKQKACKNMLMKHNEARMQALGMAQGARMEVEIGFDDGKLWEIWKEIIYLTWIWGRYLRFGINFEPHILGNY